MSRQRILDTAASQNGVTEFPPHSNRTQYGEWYGLNGERWCAIFVSWVYNEAGHPLGKIDMPKGFQSCASGYNYWKAKKKLTSNPQAGDIVLYDWDGDGICDHTGIFIKWIIEGTSFQAWEGNTSFGNNSDGGGVMCRERKKSSVKAFVNPGVVDQEFTPVSDTLEKGDIGASVTNIQKKLYDLGYVLVVDGDFGKETDKAVKQFQKDKGLVIDGKVTAALISMLDEELSQPNIKDDKIVTGSFLKKGDSGSAVVALQTALKKKNTGYSMTVDGVFGSETLKSLKAFQKDHNLKADGVAGPETFKALRIVEI